MDAKGEHPAENESDWESATGRLTAWSPLFGKLLRIDPGAAGWLAQPANHLPQLKPPDLIGIWQNQFAPDAGVSETEFFEALRQFRRRISLRIAFREVNDLCDVRESFSELTWLAERCLDLAIARLRPAPEKKYGGPRDEATGKKARFCVLGLGKFGGEELNFCSDLDLIFLADTRGKCQKGDRVMPTGNLEFFTRLIREISAQVQKRTGTGFLYNVDLRLRPQGDGGSAVHSLEAMEHYYYTDGQVWERLALIKARPVAGDRALGEEFLEIVSPFRYPRHPPAFVLENIAGVKIRTEREVVGEENLARHLKTGRGGIREIEFFVQALQLLNGGNNPFLQSPSTLDTLEKLERYGVIDRGKASMLKTAYLALRRLENCVQIREEKQTHVLPESEAEMEQLAEIAGFSSPTLFLEDLGRLRDKVHANYSELIKPPESELAIQNWTQAFTGGGITAPVADAVQGWFGDTMPPEEAVGQLRSLVIADAHNVLTRAQVVHFLALTETFSTLVPSLARPLETVRRVSRFSHAYGAPRQFLKTCGESPHLLRALCLLFDRSKFIFDLLCKHPSIIEEVLGTGFRHNKSIEEHREEIRRLPGGEEFPRWLWLYVKAEQVRIAVRDLLGDTGATPVSEGLNNLSEAAVAEVLGSVEGGDQLAVVALGKFGGEELTFGSDLDLIILGNDAGNPEALGAQRRAMELLSFRQPLGRTFEVDLRLRPHGDAGPTIVTPPALRKYHDAGGAQFWERMVLVRARPIVGAPDLVDAFHEFRKTAVFDTPVSDENLAAIGEMRTRIQREKGSDAPPACPIKAGRGGLIDVEFLCQRFQLTHGRDHPGLQTPNTAAALQKLGDIGIVGRETTKRIAGHYAFLRDVERALRRESNEDTSVISAETFPVLAKWLGRDDESSLADELRERMDETRALVRDAIAIPGFPC